MVVDELGFNAFSAELHAAMVDRKENRETSLDLLSTEKSVIVYSYGARGRDAAQQLRKAGINCLLFDNSQRLSTAPSLADSRLPPTFNPTCR